jgi:hypothetical protein
MKRMRDRTRPQERLFGHWPWEIENHEFSETVKHWTMGPWITAMNMTRLRSTLSF